MKKIFKRIKEEKGFRFELIIGIWSALIIIAIVLVIVFGVKYAINKGGNPKDSKNVVDTTAKPEEATEAPTGTPEPTAEPENLDDYFTDDDAGLDEPKDEENNLDSDSNEDVKSTEAPSQETVYATTTVNVRTKDSTTAASLGKLSAGQSVTRIEQMSDGWSKIKYNGKEAYVKSDFLTKNAPSSKNQTNNKATAKPKTQSTKKPAKTKAPSNTKDEDDKAEDNTKAPAATEPPQATKSPVDSNDAPIAATSEPAISSFVTSEPGSTQGSQSTGN